MPSNISFPKFGLSAGFNVPGGIINCNLFKIFKRSSGNPSGYGLIGLIGKEKGIPNPGMAGPLGPSGIGIDTSFGLQGIIFFYISSHLDSPGTFGSNGPKDGSTLIDSATFSIIMLVISSNT